MVKEKRKTLGPGKVEYLFHPYQTSDAHEGHVPILLWRLLAIGHGVRERKPFFQSFDRLIVC